MNSLPKQITRLDLVKDVNLDPIYEGLWIDTWKDPSRVVLRFLLDVLTKEGEELEKFKEEHGYTDDSLQLAFAEHLCRCFIATNVAEFKFATPDEVIETLNSPDVPYGLFAQVMIAYVSKIFTRSDKLKKKSTKQTPKSPSGSEL